MQDAEGFMLGNMVWFGWAPIKASHHHEQKQGMHHNDKLGLGIRSHTLFPYWCRQAAERHHQSPPIMSASTVVKSIIMPMAYIGPPFLPSSHFSRQFGSNWTNEPGSHAMIVISSQVTFLLPRVTVTPIA